MSRQIQLTSRAMELADLIEKGVTTAWIIKEYPSKLGCSQRTVERMIALAKDLVIGRIRDADMVLDILRSEAISEDIATQLLSNIELHANLCKVAACTVTYEKVYNTKTGFKRVHVQPDINMQLKAINMLLKARENMHLQQKEHSGRQQSMPLDIFKNLSEEERKIVDAI